ncbi:MAG TPA: hypothetical protein VFY29_19895 [Terriglobia bacterium]|nr:hypothetical protein [Terriglobia bacterium]
MLRTLQTLCLLLATVAAGSVGAQTSPRKPLTRFDPGLDMLPIRNTGVPRSIEQLPSQRKPTDDGWCQGITDTSVGYFIDRTASGGKSMADLSRAFVQSAAGVPRQLAERAQIMSMRRNVTLAHPDNVAPRDVSSLILERLQREGMPQILHLMGPGGNHSVAAYDAVEFRDRIVFKVADPNYPPGDPMNARREVVYVRSMPGRQGGWAAYEGLYTGVGLRAADARATAYFVDSLKEAARTGKPLPLPPSGPNDKPLKAISAGRDKAGGVLVSFEPATGDGPQLTAAEWQTKLMAFLDENRPGSLVLTAETSTPLERLSLRAWLASGAATLGRVNRVFGYEASGADLVILGSHADDAPPIDGDILIAALIAIYRDGGAPFVSLDPDPITYYGPQHVRVGGLSGALARSAFVRVLLDADYDMKRINLGELMPETPDFRSFAEIARRAERPSGGSSRFWMTPAVWPAGDVFQSEHGALFRSGVLVQTERDLQLADYQLSAPPPDREAQEAAAEMTRRFDALARRVPTFAALLGAFDVAKLAAVLRFNGVRLEVLDEAMKRPVREVDVPAAYSGIGPKVINGTTIVIGGGVETEVRLSRTSVVRTGSVDRFPAESRSDSDGATAAMYLQDAISNYRNMRLEACLESSAQAIALDPRLDEARIYRALALASLGRPREAVRELDAVVARMKPLAGLRGMIRMLAGDVSGANADVDAAAREAPTLDEVWEWNARVKVLSLNFSAAKVAIDKLFSFDPSSLRAQSLAADARMLSRMGPARARAFVNRQLAVPLPLADALWDNYSNLLLARDPSSGAGLDHALDLAERLPPETAASTYAVERILLLRALQGAMGIAASLPAANGASATDSAGAMEKLGEELRSGVALWRTRFSSEAEYRKLAEGIRRQLRDLIETDFQNTPAARDATRLAARHSPVWPSARLADAMTRLALATRERAISRDLTAQAFGDIANGVAFLDEAQAHAEAADEATRRAAEGLRAVMTAPPGQDPLLVELSDYYGQPAPPIFVAMAYWMIDSSGDSMLNASPNRRSFLEMLASSGGSTGSMAAALVRVENRLVTEGITQGGRSKSADDMKRIVAGLLQDLRGPAEALLTNGPGERLDAVILFGSYANRLAAAAAGSDPALALRVTRSIQRLPGDWPIPEAIKATGGLRAVGFGALCEAYRGVAFDHADIRRVIDRAVQGEFVAADLQRAATEAARALNADIRNRDGAFAAAMTSVFLGDLVPDIERQAIHTIMERLGSGAAADRIRDLGRRELDRLDAEIERPGRGPDPFADIASRLRPAIDAATTPGDLEMFDSVTTMFFAPLQQEALHSGELEMVARIEALREGLRGQSRLKRATLFRVAPIADR